MSASGGARELAVVRALAVLGEGARLREIALVADLPGDEAAEALQSLESTGAVSTGPIRLLDARSRAPLLEGLSGIELSRLHRRAAEALTAVGAPVEQIARHLDRVDPFPDPWAIAAQEISGNAALAAGDRATGVDRLRWCVAAGVDEPRRSSLALKLAEAELEAGDHRGIDRLRWLSATTTTPESIVDVAETLYATGRFREAAAAFALVLPPDRAGAADLDLPRARALAGQVISHLLLAELPEQLRRALSAQVQRRRGLPLTTPVDRLVVATAASGIALGMDATIADARRDLEAALDAPGPPPSRCLQESVPVALALVGDPATAVVVLDDAIDLATAEGAVSRYISLRSVRGFCMLLLGRVAEAEADAEDVLRLGERNPVASRPALAPARYVLVSARLLRGALSAARDAIDGVTPDSTLMGAWERCAAALVAQASGDPAAALRLFTDAGETFSAAGGQGLLGGWRSGAAEAALALGENAQAQVLLLQEREAAQAAGSRLAESTARRLSARLAPDPGAQLAAHAAALELAEEAGAPLEIAAAQIEHGAAVRRHGSDQAARAMLREGLDLARRCDAPALAEAAATELRAAGARRIERPATGVGALTPAERRVVEIAARSASNQDIARQLFLSVKTVETHLSSSYRKLGVRDRGALAAALNSRPTDQRPT